MFGCTKRTLTGCFGTDRILFEELLLIDTQLWLPFFLGHFRKFVVLELVFAFATLDAALLLLYRADQFPSLFSLLL